MPRIYVGKGRKKYSDDDLDIAVKKVTEGMSIVKASKQYSVPYETLRRWVTKPPCFKGSRGPTALSTDEEKLIVEALQFTAKCGYPLGRKDVVDMVESYLKLHPGRKTPFCNNRPGPEWLHNFENRWKDQIGKIKQEILTKAIAERLSTNVVDNFFRMYEKILDENNLRDQPERIFNLDEVGLCIDPRNTEVFVPLSYRAVYMKAAESWKTMYSVLFCASASGSHLPPFIIYKSMHLCDTWTEGGPPGAAYVCTKSGWMDGTVFEQWFKIFTDHVKSLKKPILLLLDGHPCHLTYQTVKYALDNEIIIICHPPNTNHALQPPDVGVFGLLKSKWRDILKEWFIETRLKAMDKAIFPALLRNLLENFSETNVVNGFKSSGLFPPNPNAFQHHIVTTESSDFLEAINNSLFPSNITDGLSMPPDISSTSEPSNPVQSPDKDLNSAVIDVISPKPSASTQNALENSKAKRKRVQAKSGGILTSEEVASCLKAEKDKRKAKERKIDIKGFKHSHYRQQPKASLGIGAPFIVKI